MKFELYSKTNKDKSIEICPPLFLKPTDICAIAHVRCQEPKQVSKRFQFKKRQQYFAFLKVITLCPPPTPSNYDCNLNFNLLYCSLRRRLIPMSMFLVSERYSYSPLFFLRFQSITQ